MFPLNVLIAPVGLSRRRPAADRVEDACLAPCAPGAWVGGDHAPDRPRLIARPCFSNAALAWSTSELRPRTQRALAAATARNLRRPDPGESP